MSKRQKEKAAARKAIRKAAPPKAELNLLRMPASKVRLVVDLVRGKKVEEALNILTFTPKSAAKPLAKLLRSAVANADAKGGYDIDQLIVADAQVGEAPQMKRFRPRAMGRANRILKRTCHVVFQLDRQGAKKAAAKKPVKEAAPAAEATKAPAKKAGAKSTKKAAGVDKKAAKA